MTPNHKNRLTKLQAEVFSEDDKELLWTKGLLGDSVPKTLLDIMIFCNGLYFALKSGKEHRQLKSKPCQIELVERPGERSFLKYTVFKAGQTLRIMLARLKDRLPEEKHSKVVYQISCDCEKARPSGGWKPC